MLHWEDHHLQSQGHQFYLSSMISLPKVVTNREIKAVGPGGKKHLK